MKESTASSFERRQVVTTAVLPLSSGLLLRNTALLSAFWVKNITPQSIAAVVRPRFCSSSHAPNYFCIHSRHH